MALFRTSNCLISSSFILTQSSIVAGLKLSGAIYLLITDSPKDREKKWADFVDSIESRTANGTKIILIMTRWHEDDLAGRLIENYGDRTTVVNLPCEAEEGDPLGRKIGDPLCPEIGKGKEWLKDFKKSHMTESGMRSWNALYQGHPSAREGNIIKREWWEYYTEEELEKATFDKIIMSVDAAFKDSEKNDFVAISVWGKRGEQYWLLDMQNKHLNLTATVKAIKATFDLERLNLIIMKSKRYLF